MNVLLEIKMRRIEECIQQSSNKTIYYKHNLTQQWQPRYSHQVNRNSTTNTHCIFLQLSHLISALWCFLRNEVLTTTNVMNTQQDANN